MSQSPSDSPGERAGAGELTESVRHRILAVERRRVALDLLSARTAPVGLEELAEAIVAHEDDGERPQSEHVDRVAVTLHHSHLPMMSDAGIIRYEPTSRRVDEVNVDGDVF